MNDGTQKLIEAMREAQADLTDIEFARRLGIAQSTLSMLYGGKRRPGTKVLSALVAYSPETKQAVDIFLQKEITSVLRINATGEDSIPQPA